MKIDNTTRAIATGAAITLALGWGIPLLLGVSVGWGAPLVIGGFVAYTMMSLSGNKSVVCADEQARAAALALSAPAGSGLLVIYREGFFGKASGVDVALDGGEIAQLKSRRFTAISVPPGRHALRAVLTGTVNEASKPGAADFQIAAGEAVVFRITLAMKLTTGDVVLDRIDSPATAIAKLRKMQMVAATALQPTTPTL
jgi:hypothetical protein